MKQLERKQSVLFHTLDETRGDKLFFKVSSCRNVKTNI